MAAATSYLFIPTTAIHLNLDIHNALPPSRKPFFSSLSKSNSMPPHSSYRFHHAKSAVVAGIKGSKATAFAQDAQQFTVQDDSAASPQAKEQGPKEADTQEGKTQVQTTVLPSKLTKLYVGNLPQDCDNEKLTPIFSQFGPVDSVEVIRNEGSGINRGFAYVSMGNHSSAVSAIEKLQASNSGVSEAVENISVKPATVEGENMSEMSGTIAAETPYKVYVGNLSRSVNAKALRDLFSQYGNVVDASHF